MRKLALPIPPPPFPLMIQNSVCGTIQGRLSTLIKEVQSIGSTISSNISGVVSTLTNLRDNTLFSIQSDIDQAIADIESGLDLIIVPPIDLANEVAGIINLCAYLQIDPFLSDPATLIANIAGSVQDTCINALLDISEVPELAVGAALSAVSNILASIKAPSVIINARLLLQCLSTMCGVDVTLQMNIFTGVLDANFITTAGIFEPSSLMLSLEIDTNIIDNINGFSNIVDNVYSSIQDNVDEAVNSFKDVF